jgi:hypothetical protein
MVLWPKLSAIPCRALNLILKGEVPMPEESSRRRFLEKAGAAAAAAVVGTQVAASGQGNLLSEAPQTLTGQMPAAEFTKFFNDLCAVGTDRVALPSKGMNKGMAPRSDESVLSVMRKYGISTDLPPAILNQLKPLLSATTSSERLALKTKCSVCSACTVCELCAKLNAGAGGAASANLFTLNGGDT